MWSVLYIGYPHQSMDTQFFLITLCWSLCGSLVAYLKLVLVNAGKAGAEKKKVTALAYGLLGVMELVIAIIDGYNMNTIRETVTMTAILMVMLLNLGLFVRASASARRHAGVPPGFALVAAAVLFDSAALFYLLPTLIGLSLDCIWLVKAGFYSFYTRLIAAAVLLLNRRPKEQWSSYLARQRSRVI